MIKYNVSLHILITDGEDFRATFTTVGVSAAEMSKSFTINIINDNIVECDETFKITLSFPTPLCEVVNGRNDITERSW